MFAKVENGVTKSCQNFAGKIEKNTILAGNFPLFEQDRLLFARVEIGVMAEFPDKNSQKRRFFVGLRFKSKVCAHPLKISFLPRKNELWGGITSKLAS